MDRRPSRAGCLFTMNQVASRVVTPGVCNIHSKGFNHHNLTKAIPVLEQKPVIKRLQHTSSVTEVDENELDVLYQKIVLELKGHDPSVLKSYEKFVSLAAQELDITISDINTPKRRIHRMSVLKSAHVHKKHFVQYEMRTHFKIIEMKYLTGSTADTYLEYIQRNLPEGIAMKVTKHRIEALPSHVRQSDLSKE